MAGSAQAQKINTRILFTKNVKGTRITHAICSYYNNQNKERFNIEIIRKINYKITLLFDTAASVIIIDKENILGTTKVQTKIRTIIIDHKVIIVDNLFTHLLN